jgi:threonine/homoserine efflux transporter RhtA
MLRRKRSAIAHNVVFHVLSVAFLLGWHALRMKSALGVAIDVVPDVVMAAYIVTSRRVRRTLRE